MFTLLKNAVATAFLVGLIILFTRGRELKHLTKHGCYKLDVIGGSLPFILFFTGLIMIPATSTFDFSPISFTCSSDDIAPVFRITF